MFVVPIKILKYYFHMSIAACFYLTIFLLRLCTEEGDRWQVWWREFR